MPVFSYRAINDDNKEVRGVIDAADLDTANQALQDQHLDVVELHEASHVTREASAHSAEQQPMLKTTFAFEGTDSSGTVRRGTVQSESKYQAFERLKHDQQLLVTMLSPLGVTPEHRDSDLENWQRKDMTPVPAKPTAGIPSVAKPIQFTVPTIAMPIVTAPASSVLEPPKAYHPLSQTLRLYAGWLLAWYGLFVALGYYAHVRALPWVLPFVEAFFLSPMIFNFIVAIFLFLFLGSMQRAMHGKLMMRTTAPAAS